MRHNAFRIGIESLLEALKPFLVVEAEAPIQAEIKPTLCLGRMSGDSSGMTPKVEIFHTSSVIQTPSRHHLRMLPSALLQRHR
jgi:hypothetical protein